MPLKLNFKIEWAGMDQCIHGKCHHLNTQLLVFFSIRIKQVLWFSVLCKIVTEIAFCLKLRICDNPRKVTICYSIGIFCQFLRNDLGFCFWEVCRLEGRIFFFFLASIITTALIVKKPILKSYFPENSHHCVLQTF